MATLNANFKLKNPKSEEETMILLKVYMDGGKRMVYSIRRSVLPSHWDDKAGRVKKVSGSRELRERLQEINSRIGKISAEVDRLSVYYNHQGIEPTVERLKKDLSNTFGKVKGNRDKTQNLNEYIDAFIEQVEKGERLTKDGGKYAEGTIKNFKGFQAQLNKYQDKRGRKLSYEGITMDFYDSFVKYFVEKSYSVNTIGRHIKNLKTLMRFAQEEGLHSNDEYKRFKVLKEEVVAIYLSLEELEKMYEEDLSKKQHLEVARDVFLIGAFSALRVSDYTRIRKEHIKTSEMGHPYIDIITQKTKEAVKVPIWHWIMEDLLKKYDFNVPHIYAQKLNKYIKDVGEIVKINELIELEQNKKGMKVSVSAPKHSLIVTHTARRSGATNMYKHRERLGITTKDIMNITGHKTESTFFAYIRVTKEETVDRIMSNRFAKPLKAVN